MKAASVLLFACLVALEAQTPPNPLPNLPDDTQIAVFEDGTKFTMGDFKRIYATLPPENQQLALRDRQLFLKQWALMRNLAHMAEMQKLDQQTPVKEQLEYYRLMILSQAKMNQQMAATSVEPGDIARYYEANKDKFKVVKVKAIYISFDDAPDPKAKKKALTEAQAKDKASALLTKIRGGTNFVSLVKDNSDDETSREKDGDFITLRANDNVPEAVRTAVFGLSKGQGSGPVKQQNGYYLLLADDVTYRPVEQVRDEIFSGLKQQTYGQWMDKTNRESKVQFTSPEFLGLTPMPVTVK
jgi:peptidyl-prolyl cis-trans isomerase C